MSEMSPLSVGQLVWVPSGAPGAAAARAYGPSLPPAHGVGAAESSAYTLARVAGVSALGEVSAAPSLGGAPAAYAAGVVAPVELEGGEALPDDLCDLLDAAVHEATATTLIARRFRCAVSAPLVARV